jgi:hypothetical protein
MRARGEALQPWFVRCAGRDHVIACAVLCSSPSLFRAFPPSPTRHPTAWGSRFRVGLLPDVAAWPHSVIQILQHFLRLRENEKGKLLLGPGRTKKENLLSSAFDERGRSGTMNTVKLERGSGAQSPDPRNQGEKRKEMPVERDHRSSSSLLFERLGR